MRNWFYKKGIIELKNSKIITENKDDNVRKICYHSKKRKERIKTKKLKENSGITLIALVITIIVMLILVAVTITLSVNGGLFEYAKDAVSQTNEALQYEKTLGDVEENLTTDGLIAKYTGTENTSEFGLMSNGTFVGQKSIGKYAEGEEDNLQTTNPNASGTGYVFQAGHFVNITNYEGYLWDETTQQFVNKTGADVFLCWDGDYGTITSVNDLINYADIHGVTTSWDIFSPEGVFLSYYYDDDGK